MNYEGTTASGARSGATGSTSALAGQNTGSSGNTGYSGNQSSGYTGNQGTTSTTTRTGTTGSRGAGTGITEGFAGLNLTHRSGVSCDKHLLLAFSIILNPLLQLGYITLLKVVSVCSLMPTTQSLVRPALSVTPSTTQR